MQHHYLTLISRLRAACFVACFYWGCGVGQESPRRTSGVEGKLVLTKEGVQISIPLHKYFVQDNTGEIVVDIDVEGSFFFAIVPRNGSDLQFIDGDKDLAIPLALPPLEDGDTVRMVVHYDDAASTLSAEVTEIEGGSGGAPTPTPPGGGSGVPVTRTPTVIRTPGAVTPTPVSSSPFDSQGSTSSFGIPGGLTGNISVGRRLYQQQCTSCHGEVGGGWRFGRLKTRIGQSPMFLSIPDRDLANITAFLNRGAR